MFTVVVTIHVFVAVALVLVVLLQSSKGESLAGSAFGGGGGGGASFGGTRGSAMSKLTTVLAILFMLNCIILTLMSGPSSRGISLDSPEDARSIVTEQMQKELESQRALTEGFTSDDAATGIELNLDSLISVGQTPSGESDADDSL